MNHLFSQWRTASQSLVRALTDQGVVDVARSLWDDEMNSPGDLEFEVGFEPTWEEIEEARRYISRVSQDMLRARHGDTITVYRSGPVDSNRPQATTLKRYTAETFGEPGTYQVNTSDVLYYSEALWGHGTFAEEEVGVMGRDLRVGKTAATIQWARNPEKSPDMGSMYGQDIEPAGRYIIEGPVNEALGWETGTITFRNPLYIEFGGGYGEATNWKRVLSERYGGLTGQALSRAIVADGYDAIITRDSYGTSEIVDLTRVGKMAAVQEIIEKYRDHQPDSHGSWSCFAVAPQIEKQWGYKAVEGYYSPEGDLMQALDTQRLYTHWWNLLPDGRILDATAGQWRMGESVRIVPGNDPRYITWQDIPSDRRDEVLDFTMWTHFTGNIMGRVDW